MIRYYYTLDEVISKLGYGNWYKLNPSVKGFFSIINRELNSTVKHTMDDENDKEVFEVVSSRFANSYVLYIDAEEEPTTEEIKAEFDTDLAPKIYGWLVGEKQKYDIVLNELNAIVDWMAPITTSTTNKFNDTPQENVDGSADPFTSNITNTINSTDGASPAVRYAEIREVADKVLSDVADGFRQFVIYA